jgi:hypothetical protein
MAERRPGQVDELAQLIPAIAEIQNTLKTQVLREQDNSACHHEP